MKEVVFVETPYIDRNCERIMAPFAISKIVNRLPEIKDSIAVLDFQLLIKKNSIIVDETLYERMAKMISDYNPQIVVFSSTKFVNFVSTLRISEQLKNSNPDVVIIYGGHQSSIYYKYILQQFEFVDYIVYGDNIDASCNLIKDLLKNNTIGEDVLSRKNLVVSRIRNEYDDTDTTNIFRHDAFEEPYFNNDRKLDLLLEIGRGCSSNCIKCTGCIYRGYYKKNDLGIAKSDLRRLFSQNIVNSLYIYDLFLLSNNEITDLCNYIIYEKLDIKWYTRTLINRLNEELVLLMKKAGCVEILVSVEKNGIVSDSSISMIKSVYALAGKCNLTMTFCFAFGEELHGEYLKKLFNIIYENIDNEQVCYEFSIKTINNYYDLVEDCSENTRLELSSLKGIDFMADGVFFHEDLDFIKKHKVLFINCFTSAENVCNRVYARYSVFLLKYFRRSLEKYMKLNVLDVFDAMNEIFQNNGYGIKDEKELISCLKYAVGEANIVEYEECLYSIQSGRIDDRCLLYWKRDSVECYILRIDYDMRNNNDDLSFYIIRKIDSSIKVYQISGAIYEHILQHIDDIDSIDSNLKSKMKKQGLL